jgi:hypothetical protein
MDVYLVLDDFGERLGRGWRDTGEERCERESLIRDLLEQYSEPVRVVAFDTAENWSRDISEEIADWILQAMPAMAPTSRHRRKISSSVTAAPGRYSCSCR